MDIKKILIHLAIAVGVALILLLGAMLFLNIGTQHNREIAVPDFHNMSVPEAEALAKEANVRIDVVDSVFVKRMAKGAVFKQNPLAGSMVKKGRRILLTINAHTMKTVEVPNVKGWSLRQATSVLQSRGLTLGKLIYVGGEATDNVRDQSIAYGTKVETGTPVDLILELESKDCHTLVPKLEGVAYMTAVDAIHGNSLNVGKVICDTSVVTYNDSLRAVVYNQKPASQYKIRKGSPVTIYLTKNPDLYKQPKGKE